jgi:hypothetical protein
MDLEIGCTLLTLVVAVSDGHGQVADCSLQV